MRLIDADALANYANNQIVGITANDIMRFPTVDAEPIKHGHWIVADDGVTRCSICYGASDYERSFCGDCGAKMDLKDGESK